METRLLSFPSGAAKAQGTTVIIDVFRAFTTAAYAFAGGAEEIIMVGGLDDALALKSSGRVDLTIGERDGFKAEGFDFGNSPTAMVEADLAGKRLAQTTTNGTASLVAATGADRILTGAFVNLSATVDAAAAGAETLSLVAAGRKGTVRTDEDELCAHLMRSHAQGRPFGRAELRAFLSSWFLTDTYLASRAKLGPPSDWELACDVDRFDFAIEVGHEEGVLVARVVSGGRAGV